MDQVFFMKRQGTYFKSKLDLCYLQPWTDYYREEYFSPIYLYNFNPNAIFARKAHPEYEHNLFERRWLVNVIDAISAKAAGALVDVATRNRFVLGIVDDYEGAKVNKQHAKPALISFISLVGRMWRTRGRQLRKTGTP